MRTFTPKPADIEKKVRLQDTRGRAHDVLWMASLAIRAGQRRGSFGREGGRALFDVLRSQLLGLDPNMGDEIRITVIATGFDRAGMRMPTPAEVRSTRVDEQPTRRSASTPVSSRSSRRAAAAMVSPDSIRPPG